MPAAEDWIHFSRPFRTTPSQSTGVLACPQKMSACEEFGGNPFLSGVDDLHLRHSGRDLANVFFFDRVAKDDPCGHGTGRKGLGAGVLGLGVFGATTADGASGAT